MPLPISREGLFSGSSDVAIPSAARTASGTSDQIATGGPITGMVVEVNVTALGGTSPSVTLDLEDTFDGVTWNKVADIDAAAITATGATVKRIDLRATPCTDRLRIAYTIAGTTPSVTFAVNTYSIRA